MVSRLGAFRLCMWLLRFAPYFSVNGRQSLGALRSHYCRKGDKLTITTYKIDCCENIVCLLGELHLRRD